MPRWWSRKECRKLDTRYRLLRDWYGGEAARVEMAAHCPSPRSVAETVRELSGDFVDPDVQIQLQLELNWQTIAGADAGRWLQICSFRNGVLELEVRHAALLREFAGCADLWRDRVNTVLNRSGVCREVRFVPAGRRK